MSFLPPTCRVYSAIELTIELDSSNNFIMNSSRFSLCLPSVRWLEIWNHFSNEVTNQTSKSLLCLTLNLRDSSVIAPNLKAIFKIYDSVLDREPVMILLKLIMEFKSNKLEAIYDSFAFWSCSNNKAWHHGTLTKHTLSSQEQSQYTASDR